MVSLSKGGKVNLSKEAPGLTNVGVELGWDPSSYDKKTADLDSSAFLSGSDGKVRSEDDFIFYHHTEHSSGCIKHSGDVTQGGGKEIIEVYLDKVPADIEKISFTCTIYDKTGKLNFGQVKNAYIRIFDLTDGHDLIRYDLEEDFFDETGIVVGELYRRNGDWKFNAVGKGSAGGLEFLCGTFGVGVKQE